MTDFLGWTGTILGCVGALLLALNVPISRYAFICFIAANVFLISYASRRADYPVLALYLVMTLISLVGVRRWFRRRVGRGPIEVTLECEEFARRQRAARAILGQRMIV